jgi:IrrE N-terminal-like domain
MSNMRDDHKVDFLREEEIEEAARTWLCEAGILNHPYFNIVTFVNNFLMTRLRKKGQLKIEFFDAGPNDKPSYVSFKPHLTLNIDREIWRLADIGEPFARFIVAHEVGHIILHNAFAQAFSDDAAVRIKYFPKENSAEWQANTFAYYFLLPTHIVTTYDDVETLIQVSGATREMVMDRLTAVRATKCRSQIHEGDSCSTCGNFSLFRIGTTLWCSTCQRVGRNSEAYSAG